MWKTLADKVKNHKRLRQQEIFSTTCFLKADVIAGLSYKNDISKLRVFISHGTKDPMLKIEYARNAKVRLTNKHCQISYHEYDDVHTINESMYKDLVSWLSTNLH